MTCLALIWASSLLTIAGYVHLNYAIYSTHGFPWLYNSSNASVVLLNPLISCDNKKPLAEQPNWVVKNLAIMNGITGTCN